MSLSHRLASVAPSIVAAWLRARGWRLAEVRDARYSRFHLSDSDRGEFEVDVPASQSVGDFARRMRDVVFNLGQVEQRSMAEVLDDILRVRADIVRMRWDGPAVASGRVPVELGARAVHLSRDMLLAAACATLERKRVFTKRKRNEAMNFLGSALLAPPQSGSFVLTVEVPLPPHLQQSISPAVDEPPYERRVMVLLSEAVQAAHAAASEASGTGDIDPIVDAVAKGVSANLCDSISGMLESKGFDGVELSFGWSPTRPTARSTPSKPVRFTPDQGDVLREAAKILRAAEPEPDFALKGPVVTLSSDRPSEAGGEVKVAGVVDGVVRRIAVGLNSMDYNKAVEAHGKEMDVVVEGELTKHGHRYVLESPRGFGLAVEDAE